MYIKIENGQRDSERGLRPGPIIHIGDQGATSPGPDPSTTDLELPSAFGGDSSARSNTAAGVCPAQELG
jgi:hypothetical protein